MPTNHDSNPDRERGNRKRRLAAEGMLAGIAAKEVGLFSDAIRRSESEPIQHPLFDGTCLPPFDKLVSQHIQTVLDTYGVKLNPGHDMLDDDGVLWTGVTLPDGWTVEQSSHPMWVEVKNENGLEVAKIFWKRGLNGNKPEVTGAHAPVRVEITEYSRHLPELPVKVRVVERTIDTENNEIPKVLFEYEVEADNSSPSSSSAQYRELKDRAVSFIREDYPQWAEVASQAMPDEHPDSSCEVIQRLRREKYLTQTVPFESLENPIAKRVPEDEPEDAYRLLGFENALPQPIENDDRSYKVIEAWGGTVGQPFHDGVNVFREVKLPEGWYLETTPRSLRNPTPTIEVIDEYDVCAGKIEVYNEDGVKRFGYFRLSLPIRLIFDRDEKRSITGWAVKLGNETVYSNRFEDDDVFDADDQELKRADAVEWVEKHYGEGIAEIVAYR